jgi:ribosomal protein S18 acetylase RimI-like enzyme
MAYRTALTADDPSRIERLVARTGVFNADEVAVARSVAEEALSRGAAAGYEFIFVDTVDALAAFASYGPIPGTERRYELYWIAVDPAAQKAGLAKALLAQAERGAAAAGAVRIFAETSGLERYRPAHALYLRAGYGLIATVPDYHADGDSMLIFGKQLQPDG